MLQPQQFLNVHEILQAIVVYLQAFYRQLPLERVRIELTNLIMIHIQFLQLLQILQAINLHNLIP